jgi:hypothetical protein
MNTKFDKQIDLKHNFDHYFDSILDLIEDRNVKDFVKHCLDNASMRFRVGGSGHEKIVNANDKYGLYRHTKATCDIAIIIFKAIVGTDAGNALGECDSDIVLSGCVLHDIGKGFREPHFEYAPEWLYVMSDEIGLRKNSKIEQIIMCVRTHHGKYGDMLPRNTNEWIVHISDMIAANIW